MLIGLMNIYDWGSNISHLIQSEIYITYKKTKIKKKKKRKEKKEEIEQRSGIG